MANEYTGWLLAVYAAADRGVVLWLLGDDGQRRRLRQPLTTTFYAGGPFSRLREAWRFCRQKRLPVRLARVQQSDLFDGLVDVMALTTDTAVQPRLFRHLSRRFPDLDYYNADIPVSVQYAARFDVFPTLRCRITVNEQDGETVTAVTPLASRWQVDNPPPPLRVMTLSPDVDPSHRPPRALHIGIDGKTISYPLHHGRFLLIGLQAALKRHDPDLLLTQFGDTWLFPMLRQQAVQTGLPFHPSRDTERPFLIKQAGSYFTYGMVLHRGEQTHLYGRYHIDTRNALMFNEYDLSGVLEQAQVTGMPVQEMARRSPGAGITAMQMITALRRGILIPYTKQQAEQYKTTRTLLRSDRGGLVFQPHIGRHTDVIEIDFVSMYPSIITRFNISPETVTVHSPQTAVVPELNMPVDQTRRGLLPETLEPLLTKRVTIKTRLSHLSRWDCRRRSLQSRSTALKWLLVVAFGYAGYKRARFGRIEAHEAITAYSREALLRAKEAAEEMGYRVLHMYVDGLWVQKKGVKTETAVQPLLDEIEHRTGLPIALEGFYKWVAFLPSRQDARVPVPNRYFGVFETGEIKARGIALRRHDTPPFVADIQHRVLDLLARSSTPDNWLPAVVALLKERLAALRTGKIAPEQLLVSQRLSREVTAYRSPSPAALAAMQLQAANKPRFPGQRIRFIYTRGEPGVFAWDLPESLNPAVIDTARYETLVLRAVTAVLQPWGIEPDWIAQWVNGGWIQSRLPVPSLHGTL
ncbi:MAG: hypothetical protein D6816_18345 [Bacteroidetes bacterium]|nr:MAG: hypothetical protein D6816_18345 [Bacteroidota bacterium]